MSFSALRVRAGEWNTDPHPVTCCGNRHTGMEAGGIRAGAEFWSVGGKHNSVERLMPFRSALVCWLELLLASQLDSFPLAQRMEMGRYRIGKRLSTIGVQKLRFFCINM